MHQLRTAAHRPKRGLSLFLCLVLVLSLLPTASAAGSQPVSSSNKNKQDYTTYGNTVKSYLYENQSGGLTRVEFTNDQVVIEDYDRSFQFQSGRTIRPELPVWGGFYAGEQYNFLFFGQENPSESNRTEVIRVVKYDKNWNRLGQTSIIGAYTRTPFDGGSLRCAESGGYLYIHAARKMTRNVMTMYGMMDTGTNHQANLTLEIRESDMKLVDSYDQVWNLDFGYVSHSFNQFILIDRDNNIVTLNHADSDSDAEGKAHNGYAQPVNSRGVDLIRYDEKAGQDHFQGSHPFQWCKFSLVQGFGGTSGNNTTGASLGGFEETSSGYVSAYNYDGVGGTGTRNVYLGYTSKSGLKSATAKVSTSAGTTTPVLASTGLDGGYILWNGKSGYTVNDTLYYASYNASGKAGQVQTASGSLSDCQPILCNGKLVWYVTDNSAPVFYTLDASGVNRHGAPETPGTTTPDTGTTTPDTGTTTPDTGTTTPDTGTTTPDTGTTTPDTKAPTFSDVPASHWAFQYVEEAFEKGLVSGKGNGKFDPSGTVTYAEFCVMLANAFYPNELIPCVAQSGGKPWYWAAMTTVYRAGLRPAPNSGSSFRNDWADIAGTRLTRYEMARIMADLLPWSADDGIDYLGNAAQKLSDWNQIQSSYRQSIAVSVYYGVISGTDGNRFAGTSNMTRAQACVVLKQLLRVAGEAKPEPPQTLTMTMTPKTLELTAGQTGTVTAAVSGTSSTPSITYTSSNQNVASVSSSGIVTAKAAGTAVITAAASWQGKSYSDSAVVTVSAPAVSTEPPQETDKSRPFYISSPVEVVGTSTNFLLTAHWIDSDGAVRSLDEGVTWTNESPDLLRARNSEGNNLIALGKEGTAYVTASYHGETERITVKIVKEENRIHVSNPWRSLPVGSTGVTELMIFSTSKFYGQDITVTWSVDNPSIIAIEELGSGSSSKVRYTAKQSGEACITCRVTMADGSVAENYCYIHVM